MSSTTGRSERSTRSARRARERSAPSSDLFSDPVAPPTPHVPMEGIHDVPEPTGLHTSELNADATTNLSEPLAYNYSSELGSEITDAGPTELNSSQVQLEPIAEASPTVVWGTNVNVAQVMGRFKDFLRTYKLEGTVDDLSRNLDLGLRAGGQIDLSKPYYAQRIDDLAYSNSMEGILEVDCKHLQDFNATLYHQVALYPLEVVPALDSAAQEVYVERCRDDPADRIIMVRIFNCDRDRSLRALSPDDLDQVVSVNGMVIRLSNLIVEMTRAFFRCLVCHHTLEVLCEQGRVQEPQFCQHCHAAHTYDLVHNRCTFINKQMIKLQESPEDMPAGQTPHTVVLYVTGSMVDGVNPGDRVTVTGVYRAQPLRVLSMQRALKAVYKTYVDALHFQRQSSDRLRLEGSGANFTEDRIQEIVNLSLKPDLYERLSSAIAPSIYENEDVKKGILLQLFAGTHKDFSSVGRCESRSEINILLCGDPGTSKSQLLQYVFNLVPRAQYTSGKGSSAVGLTAFVTKDPETRQLTLQTGALVLADNGVCCIDEFDKMSDSTRSVLHEVMEQQTLSIAKAGIICQLNARTSILAAANPINSKWDPKRTIIDNIQLPHTLLSRFDLIFLILDPLDETYDARLARHLVSLYSRTAEETRDDGMGRDLLRDYICYAKTNFKPRLSEASAHYLVEEYLQMRNIGAGRGQVSAYPRQLESLIRLAEAHARMRLSQEVTPDDCREARRLQREALKQAAVDPSTGLIDVSILTTGISSSVKKRREEVALAIWGILEERGRVATFHFQRIFEDLRSRSERLVSRELFEDGLNILKNESKIEWSGNTIRKL